MNTILMTAINSRFDPCRQQRIGFRKPIIAYLPNWRSARVNPKVARYAMADEMCIKMFREESAIRVGWLAVCV